MRIGFSASLTPLGVLFRKMKKFGAVPKWFKGAACKAVIRRFESAPRLQWGLKEHFFGKVYCQKNFGIWWD